MKLSDHNINYVQLGDLAIAEKLYAFVKNDIAPDTGIDDEKFWLSLEVIIRELQPRSTALLDKREQLQAQIDDWHKAHRNNKYESKAYQKFLQQIDYIVPEVEDFSINVGHIDTEIAHVAGPQLVVPLDNIRYVLNAINARWGSLYDALYTTDIISSADGCEKIKKYNPIRGEKVIRIAREFLDRHFALESGTHKNVTSYCVCNGQLVMRMGDESETSLLKPQQFIGFRGAPEQPEVVLLCHHDLHVEICFGEGFFIGRRDHANIYDIQIESAITTIMDCEDAVASVDAEDKVGVYKNWLGLMKGTLAQTVVKDGATSERTMQADRKYIGIDDEAVMLPGRSLALIRNVGMHLYTDAVLYHGEAIPETMLDAMVTALCAQHDLLGNSTVCNSRRASVYIIKPKMHGPEEVALANELFDRVEDALGMQRHTLKMGIMDEELRTSVNLKACIRGASARLFFINTGFLDRTGDDIHTNMEAGAVVPKGEIKQAKWLQAYEESNVQVGLQCGLMGQAQIGKGMWVMPDKMNAMMATKIQHLKAGCSTSWVPSPVAATLHTLHYHRLNIRSRQQALLTDKQVSVHDILEIPLIAEGRRLTPNEIRQELENNAQGILGYVSRWVGQGVGCSKVADLHDVALMEDCATLRISSQHIANWLHHSIVSREDVYLAMERMAVIVDRQSRDDKAYRPLSDNFDQSIAFQTALALVFKGREQANGYTEFILYQARRAQKSKSNGAG